MFTIHEAEVETKLVTTPAGKMVQVKIDIGQIKATLFLSRQHADTIGQSLINPEPADEWAPPINV
jgi:hypothetical protein